MRLRSLGLATTGTTYLLMLVGSYVKSIGARQACPDWPLCWGRLVPPFPAAEGYTSHQVLAEWLHRSVAGIVFVLAVWLFIEVRRHYKAQDRLVTLGVLELGLLLTQIVLGAATVRVTAPLVSVVHLGMAVAFFTALVLLTTFSWNLPGPTAATAAPIATGSAQTTATEPPIRTAGWRVGARRMGDYVNILKPRILMLLLVAAVASMLVAVGTDLDAGTVVATLVGGALSAGSGNAFNMYLERDIDALMTRTRGRPIPSGRVPAQHVLTYGVVLALLSFTILSTFVNVLAAVLALTGATFYVVVYTLWLKRTRPSNIVIGGAAGSFPALVGWAAVTGEVTLPALILGFIIFLWTPPHFWAIALIRKEEYAAARIPMLPVVKGESVTNQQIFLYTIATLVSTTLLVVLGYLTEVYLLVAMLLGGIFVWMAFENLRKATKASAYRLFRYSILYLGLVFIAMAVDVVYVAPLLH